MYVSSPMSAKHHRPRKVKKPAVEEIILNEEEYEEEEEKLDEELEYEADEEDEDEEGVQLNLKSIGSGLVLLGTVFAMIIFVFGVLGAATGGGGWENTSLISPDNSVYILVVSLGLIGVGLVLALLGKEREDGKKELQEMDL